MIIPVAQRSAHGARHLVFDAEGFVNRGAPSQEVEVLVDGQLVTRWRFGRQDRRGPRQVPIHFSSDGAKQVMYGKPLMRSILSSWQVLQK